MACSVKARLLPCLLLLFATGWLGCISEGAREVIGPVEERPAHPRVDPLPLDLIRERIQRLTKAVEGGTLNQGQRSAASDLVSTYRAILSSFQAETASEDHSKAVQLLFLSLGRLEEDYFSTQRQEEKVYPKFLHQFNAKRKKIMSSYLAGDHQGVINECLEWEASFGQGSLAQDMGIIYAFSLAQKGMLSEAISVGQKITKELEGRPDLFHLRANILEWEIELGRKKKAQEVYAKLGVDFDERERILKQARQRMDGVGRSKPAVEQVTPKEVPSKAAEPRQVGPVERALKEAEELVQRNEFDKAKFLLIQQRIRLPEGPDTETIDQALRAIEVQEEKARKGGVPTASGTTTAALPEPPRENPRMEIARRLLREERFEDAISAFEELEKEDSTSAEPRELRQLAIDKLIIRDRGKAAKLFLMARNENQASKKEELLKTSHNILKSLVDKYPDSPLKKTLAGDMAKVREELARLGKGPP